MFQLIFIVQAGFNEASSKSNKENLPDTHLPLKVTRSNPIHVNKGKKKIFPN